MNIARAEKILNLQLDWVKSADSKVAPLFAINIAMLGVLTSLMTSNQSWEKFSIALTLLSLALLTLSIIFLGLVVFPRTNGPKGSNIFFGGIADSGESTYIENIKNLTDDEYFNDLLVQTHRNAEIVKQKYKHIKHAFMCSFNSLPFWLLTIWCIY